MSWKAKSLDELIDDGVIELGRGKVISKRDLEAHPGTYPVYSSAKENDGMFGAYGQYMFDEELITWSVDGGGNLFHRPKHKFSVTNVGGTLRLRDRSVLDYQFLFHVLTYLHARIPFDWVLKAHPSVIRRLYTEIPVPPLLEQQRIVGKLDAAFAALTEAQTHVERNRANARELFESYRTQVFEGAEWELHPLGRICDVLDSRRKPITKRDRVAGQYPYYGATGLLDHIHEFIFDEPLVLIGEDGAKWGANENSAYLVEGKYWVNNHAHVIRPHREVVLDNWLVHYLNHADLTMFVSGLTVPKLNQGQMREIPIPLPSLREQEDYLRKLEGLRTETASLETTYQQKLTELAGLKKAVLGAAFRGEL